MPEEDNGKTGKAQAFFKRAEQVAHGENFDYAIDMYLEGLRRSPDDLEGGHIPLRKLSLVRQGRGGKKPSMMEKIRLSRGKTPVEKMVNAEYLLAKDPDNLSHAEMLLKAAVEAGFKRTAKWMADLLFGANNASENPSFHSYMLLKDSYAAIGEWDRSVAACQHAQKLRPNDEELADELQRLSAELTVARGKYDQQGDFTKAIKDRKQQEKLQSQESVVKTEDYRASAAVAARKMYQMDPDLSRNIFNLASALADLRTDEAENEAIELLENTYEKKQDFSFQERAGVVRIGQLKRKIRMAKKAIEAENPDENAQAGIEQLQSRMDEVELEHYGLCVQNYPTDLRFKYEYAIRLLAKGRYDEAIPLLQEAQRDPRHKIAALNKVGLCFFFKKWYADAVDVFTHTLDEVEIKDNDTAKELRYNLARAYEEQGDKTKALDVFRKIAQLDFSYKDVSDRVNKLRRHTQ